MRLSIGSYAKAANHRGNGIFSPKPASVFAIASFVPGGQGLASGHFPFVVQPGTFVPLQEIAMASIPTVSPFNFGLVAAALCAAVLSACASGPSTQADAKPVPANLKPADSEAVAFTWHAVGSQIYECRTGDKGGWAWVFVAPEADLFNQKDEKVGTHGAGPHWAALDGSRTVGTVKARADGERPADIPLLLLTAKSAGTPGKMAAVTSVQRLNTEGGNAPATGCAVRADAGKRAKEGYSADYVFFTARKA
jgi:hypothetical protein